MSAEPVDLEPEPSDLDGTIDEALYAAGRRLRAIRRLRAERDQLRRVYDREIQRLTERWEERCTLFDREIEWHTAPLRQLHDRIIETDPRRKTIELPDGTLRMRVPKTPQVWIDDQDGLVEWALSSCPELLPPPTRVSVATLRKMVKVVELEDGWKAIDPATGETVPHVHAAMPDITWNVDTDGDTDADI